MENYEIEERKQNWITELENCLYGEMPDTAWTVVNLLRHRIKFDMRDYPSQCIVCYKKIRGRRSELEGTAKFEESKVTYHCGTGTIQAFGGYTSSGYPKQVTCKQKGLKELIAICENRTAPQLWESEAE